ncbi:helix-turn-helix domain-containing protein [Streptomyces sp. NPDC005648]|uniref:winged helix-turn-helix domain-containing protein n=1 Tax=Streptomyces sp. NPDC005648 TaxID=3157044 RepID=UPI0033B1EA91
MYPTIRASGEPGSHQYGKVVSKGKILDTVWNYGFQGESGVVETYIYSLRRKLDDADHCLIRTVRGAGYLMYAG